MYFDEIYYKGLSNAIKNNTYWQPKIIYTIKDWTTDYEKFIYHIKIFITHWKEGNNVEFNSPEAGTLDGISKHTHFRVVEQFIGQRHIPLVNYHIKKNLQDTQIKLAEEKTVIKTKAPVQQTLF